MSLILICERIVLIRFWLPFEKIWQEKRCGDGSSINWLDMMKQTGSLQPQL